MAATTTTIASSPQHQYRTPSHRLSNAPSSDDLPSLGELCRSTSGQKPRSNLIDMQDRPLPGFSSVKSLLHSGEFATSDELPPNAKRLGLQGKYARLSPTLSKKRVKSTKVAEKPEEEYKPAAGHATTGLTRDERSDIAINPPRARASRSKIEQEGKDPKISKKQQSKQGKLPKSKITKPGQSGILEGLEPEKKRQKAQDTESGPAEKALVPQAAPDSPIEVLSNVAVKRRLDWTPVKDTNKRSKQLSQGSETDRDEEGIVSTHTSFRQALGSFTFQDSSTTFAQKGSEAVIVEQSLFVKSKQIELVNNPKLPTLVPSKSKRNTSPVKKATTITEKATAPYLVPLEPSEQISEDKITRYLSGESQVREQPQSRSLQKDRTKGKVSKARKAKKKIEPTLLSPKSAIKVAQDQELLFGTSSQLARDESPTTIAIKQSERIASNEEVRKIDVDESRIFGGLLAFAPSKKLWTAASRDLDESLLNSEPVVPPARYRNAQLSRDLPEPRNVVERQQILQMQGFQDVDSVAPKTEDAQSREAQAQQTTHSVDATERGGAKADTTVNELIMPKFESFSDATLKAQVAKYGFKTIKRRHDMIVLIKQCWTEDMKRKSAANAKIVPAVPLAEGDPNKPINGKSSPEKKKRAPRKKKPVETDAAGLPVKKPRGRPKKETGTESGSPKKVTNKQPKVAPPVDEVDNIATHDILVKKPKKPPPPKHMEHFHKDGSNDTASGRHKPCYIEAHSKRILAAVGKAVSAQPPTHDMDNLSWHEKILLFDPIIIEDLTDWLLKDPLADAGESDEPSPFLVKDWCESKSVCCVWRETLRGKERARW